MEIAVYEKLVNEYEERIKRNFDYIRPLMKSPGRESKVAQVFSNWSSEIRYLNRSNMTLDDPIARTIVNCMLKDRAIQNFMLEHLRCWELHELEGFTRLNPIPAQVEYHRKYADYLMELPKGDYIITDPGYYITSDDWDRVCDSDLYDLSSIGLAGAYLRPNLTGDWDAVVENGDGEIIGRFRADSGCVGIGMLDDILSYNPEYDLDAEINREAAACLRDFEGTARFVIEMFEYPETKCLFDMVKYRLHLEFEDVNGHRFVAREYGIEDQSSQKASFDVLFDPSSREALRETPKEVRSSAKLVRKPGGWHHRTPTPPAYS